MSISVARSSRLSQPRQHNRLLCTKLCEQWINLAGKGFAGRARLPATDKGKGLKDVMETPVIRSGNCVYCTSTCNRLIVMNA